jgi:hypothetical protein
VFFRFYANVSEEHAAPKFRVEVRRVSKFMDYVGLGEDLAS